MVSYIAYNALRDASKANFFGGNMDDGADADNCPDSISKYSSLQA